MSPDGAGDGAVEIFDDEPPASKVPGVRFDPHNEGIALVGGPVGALMGGSFVRSLVTRHSAVARPAEPGDSVSARLHNVQTTADHGRPQ